MTIGPQPVRRSIRLRVLDRPGALADVTSVLADHLVDIVRLEVRPGDRDLRRLGFETTTLPETWWLRDWAIEVFNAVERLGASPHLGHQVDAVVEIASRLANTSQAAVIADPPAGSRSQRVLAAMAGELDPEWVLWTGDDRIPARFLSSFVESAVGPPRSLRPIEEVPGLAVEIPGPTAASAVLGVVVVRPPFLKAVVMRLPRFASLVGRLHPIEPLLGAM